MKVFQTLLVMLYGAIMLMGAAQRNPVVFIVFGFLFLGGMITFIGAE